MVEKFQKLKSGSSSYPAMPADSAREVNSGDRTQTKSSEHPDSRSPGLPARQMVFSLLLRAGRSLGRQELFKAGINKKYNILLQKRTVYQVDISRRDVNDSLCYPRCSHPGPLFDFLGPNDTLN